MTPSRVRFLAAWLLVVAAGCGGQSSETRGPDAARASPGHPPRLLGWCCPTSDSAIMALLERYEATEAARRPPELAIVPYRHSSGIEERRQAVIRDSTTWARVWTEIMGSHRPGAPLPAVDFAREMLVVASMGTRSSGGYSMAVDSIRAARDTVFLRIREYSPGSQCGTTGALTAPVGLARLERSEQPIAFDIEARTLEC